MTGESNMNKELFDLSNTKAVLFDFDGTLLDSNDLIADTWRHTIKTLAGRDIPDDEIRQTLGAILIDSMRDLLPEIDPEEGVDFYREYQREIFLDRIKVFDGTEELLRGLKANGYKNALVTSRMKNSTYKALDQFGVTDLFDVILTANDTDKFKPDPTPIYMVLDTLGCKTSEAIMIGDTIYDIEAGKASGVFTVLVDWSFSLPPGERRESAPQADIVINKLTDILTLLRR